MMMHDHDQRMTSSRTTPAARYDDYEVVVLGAGMGGLTAGALLAQAGKQVLMVDANERPGGYAQSIHRDAYTFDLAGRLLTGCAPRGPFGWDIIDSTLRSLGVRERCEFLRVDHPFYEARFPNFTLAVPCGREAYLDAHLRHFPHEAQGLRHLVEVSAEIANEFNVFPFRPNINDWFYRRRTFPTLFRYHTATLQQVIDEELTDPRLKAVYSTLWGWAGLPPARLPFIWWAELLEKYIEEGVYYCRGGFQRLADVVAEAFTAAGGELLLGTRATRIRATRERVQGVKLDQGQEVRAPVVIATIDARDTFETLLTPHQVSGHFLGTLREMELSPSVLALYLATDLDARALGAQHVTLLNTSWDQNRAYAEMSAGQVRAIDVLIPTLSDPSLAPPGEHIVIVQTLAPREPEAAPPTGMGAHHSAEQMLELAEQVLPGLRGHLRYVDGVDGAVLGSPQHYPVRRLGPMYGWATSPHQVGGHRLSQWTPVAGLYLAGQWTQPGPGIDRVMLSGWQVAERVLGVKKHDVL